MKVDRRAQCVSKETEGIETRQTEGRRHTTIGAAAVEQSLAQQKRTCVLSLTQYCPAVHAQSAMGAPGRQSLHPYLS